VDVITGRPDTLSEEKLLCQHLDVKVGVTGEIEGGKVHVNVFQFEFVFLCAFGGGVGRGVMLHQHLDIKADVTA